MLTEPEINRLRIAQDVEQFYAMGGVKQDIQMGATAIDPLTGCTSRQMEKHMSHNNQPIRWVGNNNRSKHHTLDAAAKNTGINRKDGWLI